MFSSIFCKTAHVCYIAVWYQYAWAGVSINFSMLYASPVSTPSHSYPHPHHSGPSPSPYPNEAPTYSGYDFLSDFVPELCSLFDLQALMIAHSLDAKSPPLHADAKSSVAKQPHIVIGHYWEAQQRWCYPFKCWSRIYAGLDRCHHLAADVPVPHSARSLLGTSMIIVLHVSLTKFNWQSLALFSDKVTQKLVRSCKILRYFEYQYMLSPHQLHVSVNSNVSAQLESQYKRQI